MRFLPIAERELRVMSHQSRTWWQRVIILGGALVVFCFAYLNFRRQVNSSMVGQVLFTVLSAGGFLFSLLAGPLTTIDCLGRERREGTLGLLFLTHLRGYDVVLGKMAAASFGMLLGYASALPIAAIPFLMGGVTLDQLWRVVLALLNIMFLSLSVGTCFSAVARSGRTSFALTVGLLTFLALGFPLLGEVTFGIGITSPSAPWFYMLCPTYSMFNCLSAVRNTGWKYWLNVGAIHAVGWICLAIACWLTSHAWRDRPLSARRLRWNERVERWSKRSIRGRMRWRQFMLERNPVAWLEGRDWQQPALLWTIISLCFAFLIFSHLLAPQHWPDRDQMETWPFFAHYILCLWVAVQAPRRLADDKQSGALELLLCTPLKHREIVQGCFSILRRRFGRAWVAITAMDLFLAYTYYGSHGGWPRITSDEWFLLDIWVPLLFPLQLLSTACIGTYQGLVAANSLQATIVTIVKAEAVPFFSWVAFMMTCGILNLLRSASDFFVHCAFTVSHVIFCTGFMIHANRQLRRNFRLLAAQHKPMAWWKRWRTQS